MATHNVVCTPESWNNADRPTEVRVYTTHRPTGATEVPDIFGLWTLRQTIPAASIDANGGFTITVDDAWPGMDDWNPNSVHLHFAGIGQANRYMYEDLVYDKSTPPTEITYDAGALGAETTALFGLNLITPQGDAAAVPGVEVTLGVWLPAEGVFTRQVVLTDEEGLAAAQLAISRQGKTYHWIDKVVDLDDVYRFAYTPTAFTTWRPNHAPDGEIDNFTAWPAQGTNRLVFRCPELRSDGGEIYLYDAVESYDMAAPAVYVDAGQDVVTIDRLGAGPYWIEIDTWQSDHDFAGVWPHVDGNDPLNWSDDLSVQHQFRLKPGVNHLGTFHIVDYPAACYIGDNTPGKKLRKVGFNQRQVEALEVLDQPAATPFVIDIPTYGSSSPISEVWVRAGDRLRIPPGSGHDIESRGDRPAGAATLSNDLYSPEFYAMYPDDGMLPEAVALTSGFVRFIDFGLMDEEGGYAEPNVAYWPDASVFVQRSPKVFMDAGFTARQARALLAMKALPAEGITVDAGGPTIFGPPRLHTAHVAVPVPVNDDIEWGYSATAATVEAYAAGDQNFAAWTGSGDNITYPAVVVPYANVLDRPDPSYAEGYDWVQSVSPKPAKMKTLLRGGFTRHQAKLLMEV